MLLAYTVGGISLEALLKVPASVLLIVDVQNDFCSNGALAVPDADSIVPVINNAVHLAEKHAIPIIYSRDWHPQDHCSFIRNGGIWPDHCIKDGWGAAFHPDLYISADAMLVNKAEGASLECYSALSGRMEGTNEVLYQFLQSHGVQHIVICGLALDYCVFESALEASKHHFAVSLLLPACRGIDTIKNQDCLRRLASMGVNICK